MLHEKGSPDWLVHGFSIAEGPRREAILECGFRTETLSEKTPGRESVRPDRAHHSGPQRRIFYSISR